MNKGLKSNDLQKNIFLSDLCDLTTLPTNTPNFNVIYVFGSVT